jgi:pimeloyl-ACP methyl ester carboxylesterase
MKKSGHLRASDAAAITRLATHATVGIANISEGVHRSVLRGMGLKAGTLPGQTGGITGLVYQSVRGLTQFVGKGLEAVLVKLEPLFDAADKAAPETPERQAVLAVLNGVLGDHLAASNNPLATPMSLRLQGQPLKPHALPPGFMPVGGKVLLLVHGLCMNDLQWHTLRKATRAGDADMAFDHGAELAHVLGYTPIYLRYNTGFHTSQNGRELSTLIDELLACWPAPIEEFSVVAHSMGGLVTRSAVHLAQQQDLPWLKHLKNVVFLGTPHHGAPLERAGNWVDVILGSTPYSKPLAKLGQIRSAGITDLRYGHVVDGDWQGHDRFRKKPDSRQPVPLPAGVNCFAVAATTAAKRSLLADRLIGDTMVPLPSALGQHEDPERRLLFAKSAQLIVYKTNHLQLLSSPEVSRQLVDWLKPA